MLPLFTLTIFAGAGLLFLVQPMIAKQLLPMLGGSPAVWNTCMVFFQITLLGGYVYAHLLSRMRSRGAQLVVHILVVVAAILTLPIGLAENAAPRAGGSPTMWLLSTLALAVGAPFFVLASASPLLQRWFAATRHRWASDPYFLYAASNAGSLLALLGFPLLIEPGFGLGFQLGAWSWGFAGFGLLALACGAVALRSRTPFDGTVDVPEPAADGASGDDEASATSGGAARLRWVLLAFVPSSLMLGVTQHISTDVATTPILWVVPLAIYLATFIVAFTRWGRAVARCVDPLVPLAAVAVGALLSAQILQPIEPQIVVHLMALAIIGIACHGRLAAERPPASRLTEFYLLLSVGGALGGVFNALAAPVLFNVVAEYPIVLVVACLLRRGRTARARPDSANHPRSWRRLLPTIDDALAVSLILALVFARAGILAYAGMPPQFLGIETGDLAPLVLPAIACLLFLTRRRQFILALIVLFAAPHLGLFEDVVHRQRTFFGVHRVVAEKDGSSDWHHLWHGSTGHGSQYTQAPWSTQATRYYVQSGPAGEVMAFLGQTEGPKEIALVGLGAGTLAAYGRPGWKLTYFEIDPEVVRIASDPELFTFIRDSTAKIEFVVGDARLNLARPEGRAPRTPFDAIVLDAFSSDAIPVHLLTKDAVEVYLKRLKPDGFLVFHITNRHLDLRPVLGNIAAKLNLVAAHCYDGEASEDDRKLRRKDWSAWVVLARRWEALGPIAKADRWSWLADYPEHRTWTDDYSNVLGVMK